MVRTASAILLLALAVTASAQPAEERERLGALGGAILAEAAPERDSAAASSLALAKLHWERAARMLSGERADWDLSVAGELEAGERALELARAGEAPGRGQVGANLTLAYEADNDRSVQPYFLYVPTGYDPATPAPLLVYLHGWLPDTTKLMPWLLGSDVHRLVDESGCLLLQPHGRGNTDFQGVGEGDVLRAIEETRRFWSVDPERIVLGGNSMGGYGAWCVGLHHPDLFSALAPACGQTDYFLWYGLERAEQPLEKRAMYEMSNPLDLMPNARNLPVLVQHGERDPLVDPEFARIAQRELARLGYEHEVRLVPGGRHEVYFAEDYWRRLLGFATSRQRVSLPRRVTLRAWTLDAARSSWARIQRIAEWGVSAEVDAEVRDDGSLSLTCRNVGRLGLRRADLAEMGVRSLTGAREGPLPEGEGEWLSLDLVATVDAPLAKRPGLCGPIRAVFDEPFVCVYGEGGGGEALLNGFLRDWWRFCEGLPQLLPARETAWPPQWAISADRVTAEDEAARNLVLFGRPEENAYLASIASELPVGFVEGGYRVGGRTWTGADVGAWFCFPNPRNPERMVLSISGEPWGAGYSLVTRFSHRYDLLPDWIVFDARVEADDGNHPLGAGFFDSAWRLADPTGEERGP